MELFRGYESAHGQYRVKQKEQDGKMSGRAITVSEPATEQNFTEHLTGSDYILGIIMLRQDNSCHFGVIDIDIRGEVKLIDFGLSAAWHAGAKPLREGGVFCAKHVNGHES